MKTKLFLKMYSRTAVRLCYCCCLLLLLAGCEEKNTGGDTPDEKPTLSVAPTSLSVIAAGGSYTFAVSSNTAWSVAVASGATWCAVSPTSGKDNGTVSVTVAKNTVIEPRTATVTFTSGTLTRTTTVTQAAADPTLSVDKTGIPFDKDAGNQSIAVTSNAAWTAAVNTAATWCTVSPASGTGNGTLTVSVAENPMAAARAATVTLTAGTLTRTVAVTQAGGDATLSVDRTGIPFDKNAGSQSIAVTSNAAWTAAVNTAATWCTLSNASATGNGTLTVTVTANPVAIQRAATVTLTAGTLTKQVAVTQAGINPTLTTDKTAIPAAYTAGNYSVAITSNAAWTAAVNTAATWCTVSPASGTGNGAVSVNVAANPMAVQRAATVTLAAGTLTKQVSVTQAGASPTLSVDKTAIPAAYTAGNYSIAVTSNATWTVTKTAAATWCTVSPASGTGNGAVSVIVAANPMAEQRAATVTLTAGTLTKQVSVTQAGASPTLSVDKTAIPAAYTAGNYAIAVTSNTAWTAIVSAGATWCTLSNASATGNGTVTVTVAANPLFESRAATLTVTAGTLTKQVAVTQAATAPTLTADKNTIETAYTGGNYTVSVTSNAAWTASVTADWCAVTPQSGSNNSPVSIIVAAHKTPAARSATLTFSAGSSSYTVNIVQSGVPTPPYAASTRTLQVGGTIPLMYLSDEIQGGGRTSPRCATIAETAKTICTWSAAGDHSLLCPSPWTAPTAADLQTIVWFSTWSEMVGFYGLGHVDDWGQLYPNYSYFCNRRYTCYGYTNCYHLVLRANGEFYREGADDDYDHNCSFADCNEQRIFCVLK
jgi:hypothetical protein